MVLLSNNDQEKLKNLYTRTIQVEISVQEEIDKYVFKVLCDGIAKDHGIVVSKELLITALKAFKAEHPEIYELMSINVTDQS